MQLVVAKNRDEWMTTNYGQAFTNLAPCSGTQTVILFLQNKYRAMAPISFLQRQLDETTLSWNMNC